MDNASSFAIIDSLDSMPAELFDVLYSQVDEMPEELSSLVKIEASFRNLPPAPAAPLRELDVTEAVARGKREILEDIANGIVPESVKNFSELHDYVDANLYGGICDTDVVLDFNKGTEIQQHLNTWILDGRP